MIKEIEYSDHSESYSYILDPRWVVLYGNKEYSLIDWSKRLQIGRGQDMAKTLQRLIATSSDAVQYYSIEWLKEKMEYSGRVRDFKNALSSSCEELKRLEIIVSWAIENSTREQKQIVLKTPKSKVV